MKMKIKTKVGRIFNAFFRYSINKYKYVNKNFNQILN